MRISFSKFATLLTALASTISAQTNAPKACPFSPGATYDVKAFARRLGVADVNGDGKLDIIVPNDNSSLRSSILLGNGDGTFQPATIPDVPGSATAVAIADLNGDGKLDLAISHYAEFSTALLGNADGTFQPYISFHAPGVGSDISIADFDGDGHPDLAIAEIGLSGVRIALGRGDGTFHTSQVLNGGKQVWAVTTGDFNRDGHPDVAATSLFKQDVSVFPEQGRRYVWASPAPTGRPVATASHRY